MTARRTSRLLGVLGLAFLATHPAHADEPAPPATGTQATGTQPAVPAPETPPAKPTAPVKEVPPNKAIAILGQLVVGPLGQVVGRMVDVLVNQDGVPQAAVIDFGGFMGVGARKIAVHWNTLHFNPGDEKYPIVLDLMPAQIQAAPGYKGETKPAPVVVAPWDTSPDTTKPGAAPEKPTPDAAKTEAPG